MGMLGRIANAIGNTAEKIGEMKLKQISEEELLDKKAEIDRMKDQRIEEANTRAAEAANARAEANWSKHNDILVGQDMTKEQAGINQRKIEADEAYKRANDPKNIDVIEKNARIGANNAQAGMLSSNTEKSAYELSQLKDPNSVHNQEQATKLRSEQAKEKIESLKSDLFDKMNNGETEAIRKDAEDKLYALQSVTSTESRVKEDTVEQQMPDGTTRFVKKPFDTRTREYIHPTEPQSKYRDDIDEKTDFTELLKKTENSKRGQTSSAGAKGEMQTMPETARDPGYKIEPAQDDSFEELERVARGKGNAMLEKYQGDDLRAAAAYNWGEGNLDKTIAYASKNNLDWRDLLPTETKNYLNRYEKLKADQYDKTNTFAGMKSMTRIN